MHSSHHRPDGLGPSATQMLVMCFAAYALILLSHMCFFYILDPICCVVASSPPDRLDLD